MSRLLSSEEQLPDYGELPPQENLIKSEPWELLICLDACRWDAYEQVYGDASPVRTPSESSTIGWMKEIWCNPRYDWTDVQYISANDITSMVGDGRKYETDVPNINQSVDDFVLLTEEGGWEDEQHTVPPSSFRNVSINTPTVLHFVQPHIPYVCGDFRFGIHSDDWDFVNDMDSGILHRPSRLVEQGMVDVKVIQAAYLSNLRATVDVVESLTSEYDTVITSDHGEAFGPDVWDHGSPYSNRNRVVPWDARYLPKEF